MPLGVEVSDRRLLQAVELSDWVRGQSEVRMGVHAVLASRGLATVGLLAVEQPEVFDELFEAMETMMKELPWT